MRAHARWARAVNAALRKTHGIPADIALSPVDTEDGMVVLAAVRDITERKRMKRSRASTPNSR